MWGKDYRVQLPKEPSVTRTVDAVCFSGAVTECSKCVCVFSSFQWRMFYKQGPGRRWICTWFAIKTWSGPSDKRPHSCKYNCIRFLSFVGNLHISEYMLMETTRNISIIAPPTARLQELFPERIGKLYFSFINMIKLKTFWRYEGCRTTL